MSLRTLPAFASSPVLSWPLVTLILASLPSLLHLPLWVGIVALLGAGLRFTGDWNRGWNGRALRLLLLTATVLGIWFSFESWFSGDAVLSFFIAVVALKWSESEGQRDALLLIFAAVILAALGALYWENLLSLLHLFLVVWALTASLVAITAGDAAPLKPVMQRSGTLFLLGLPLMALLFLSFPRIPGPLWDIGLAFGLPIKALMEKGKSDFGKVKTLQPGGIQRASQDDGTVLVAEFEGVVPYKSELYWRGPVFWDYDGEQWHLPTGWDNRGRLLHKAIRGKERLARELRHKAQPVRYTLRVMPNGGRWLYGLDVPAAAAPESFISDEFQLLSIRRLVDHEPKIQMSAYLDFTAGAALSQEQREQGLAWPEGSNPRLKALGQRLLATYPDPAERVRQGLILYANGGFQFDNAHRIAPGSDALDRFFFDEKRGGAEYLAGSFAMLMRAAGVPTRLVGGFRGGTIVALTNFVIVKQSDAHVWVEVWHDETGWGRVEPKDAVLPPEKPPRAAQQQKERTPQVMQVRQGAVTKPTSESQPAKKNSSTSENEAHGWAWLPDWSGLFAGLQKWVIDYDPDRQMEILHGVGVEESDWRDLLAGATIGLLLLAALYLVIAWWRGRQRLDAVSRAWRQFCDRLAKQGVARQPHECPRDYLARICRERPEYAAGAEDITARYIAIRYGSDAAEEAVTLFQRQVKRFTSMI